MNTGSFARGADTLREIYPDPIAQKLRYQTLCAAFAERFNKQPLYCVSASGRTELVGNHTDHNRGRVLAAAVDLDMVAAVAPSGGDTVTLWSEGYPEPFVIDLNDLEPHEGERETTAALIRGIAAGLKARGYRVAGFDACMTSDVMRGSGLSSSAALEVMLVGCFDALYNEWSIDPMTNAVVSQYAENTFFGKPSGLLDQSASALGGLVTIDFGQDEPAAKKLQFNFEDYGYRICVVSAGGEHGNLTAEYAAIPREMRDVAQAMGQETLAGITEKQLIDSVPALKGKVSDRAILRAFHFVYEDQRVADAVNAILAKDLETFMRIVIASGESSWKLLQNLCVPGSSNQEMLLALELSRQILEGRGAWRIHGGGFAGTILAFVPTELLEEYRSRMDGVFGNGATTVLNVRQLGPVCINAACFSEDR